MPRTYIVEFTIQSERKQLALLEQMKKKATQMTKEINEGKKKRRSFRMKLSRWIYDPIYQRKTYEWNRQDINFWTSSQCIKCGKCTQLCPVGNIELKQEKIIWKHQCLGCFRCVHGCPREAIEYGKNTIGRRRYKNLVLKNKEWYKIGD